MSGKTDSYFKNLGSIFLYGLYIFQKSSTSLHANIVTYMISNFILTMNTNSDNVCLRAQPLLFDLRVHFFHGESFALNNPHLTKIPAPICGLPIRSSQRAFLISEEEKHPWHLNGALCVYFGFLCTNARSTFPSRQPNL
jgi:hypothetical protein